MEEEALEAETPRDGSGCLQKTGLRVMVQLELELICNS